MLTFDGRRLTGRHAGIVRIRNAAGTVHCGMGILVGPRHILTCAHVVNDAIGKSQGHQERAGDDRVVGIEFPLVSSSDLMLARCIAWQPPAVTRGDLALLEIDAEAPPEAGIAVMAQVREWPVFGDRLSVFGYQPGYALGQHSAAAAVPPDRPDEDPTDYKSVRAAFTDIVTATRTQIDGVGPNSAFIVSGYSGAAVWDVDQDAVVGMLTIRDKAPGRQIAYAIAAAELKAFAGALPLEIRRIAPGFAFGWNALAIAVFILLLAHLLAIQGVEAIEPLLAWGPSQQLAKYWGMIFFAFLAPPFFFLFWRHVRDLRLHAWWQRVPALLRRGPVPGIHNTRVSALLVVLFFVVMPIYAQSYFIVQFHDSEGAVAIDPRDFGYTREEMMAARQRCKPLPAQECTHPEAGIYHLVTPREAVPGRDYFWDNIYRYGDEHLVDTTTFWPILAPKVIYALSAAALVFAVLGLRGLLPPRRAFPA